MLCPLCHSHDLLPFHEDARREYLLCGHCELVSVPPQQRLSLEEERRHYDLHENHADDAGYQKFLNRVVVPMAARLDSNSEGLDFGCGADSAIATLFAKHGHQVKDFDPYYFNRTELLERSWDFITATEVLEHLHDPAQTLTQLFSILKPGGLLGVMTKRRTAPENFAGWHYKNDPTHVCFYADASFEWIARRWHAEIEWVSPDTLVLKKIP